MRGEIVWQQTVEVEVDDDPESLYERIVTSAVSPFNELLAASLRGDQLPTSILNADGIYQHRVDYRGFPEVSND